LGTQQAWRDQRSHRDAGGGMDQKFSAFHADTLASEQEYRRWPAKKPELRL
jgi:hypothetical protein